MPTDKGVRLLVRPLPHQSTASRTDKASSSVIVRSACPSAPFPVLH